VQQFDIDEMIAMMDKSKEDYDRCLARMGFVQGIDEIALMFVNDHCLDKFVQAAVRHEGLTHFNGAEDNVKCLPIDSSYKVRYEFFQGKDYRIEAMAIQEGFSAVHFSILNALITSDSPSTIVHASFKCTEEEDYGMAVLRLREAGWEDAQRCESSYGRFSYWRPLDMEHWVAQERWLYLKPRVNLRDEVPALS
jgi:hypothetical protein